MKGQTPEMQLAIIEKVYEAIGREIPNYERFDTLGVRVVVELKVGGAIAIEVTESLRPLILVDVGDGDK